MAFKLKINPWILKMQNPWGNNSFSVYVQLANNADLKTVSAKIKDLRFKNIPEDERIDYINTACMDGNEQMAEQLSIPHNT